MGQHNGIYACWVKGKLLTLDSLYRVTSLVHTAVQQYTAYRRRFE
jgi:hypothetical protein